ncbi:MAG: acyltransferase [Candidatus Hydrogenedentales bacterium]|jgi:acetyltransferase-like isoleucine patch superfamily enzyme
MRNLVRQYRTWKHRRKFASAGKGCRFHGKQLLIDGHVELGDLVKIREGTIMRTHKGGRILIGDRSGISFYCVFEATTAIVMGKYTGMAEFTVVRDTNHLIYGTAEHWRLTPHIAEPIVIGHCVMIASRCYIGPGVAIGDGAVIAPNSLVTKDVAPMEVWGGSPARKLGHRVKGLIAGAMRRKYGELLEKFGIRETPYREELEAIQEAALSGVNRAAEERDQLLQSLGTRAQMAQNDGD